MQWYELAKRQHGAVGRSQLLGLGLTARQVERRILTGQLVRAHRGVYRLAGAPESFRQHVMLACLAGGGVASHRCAAALWEFRRCEQRVVEVTVPNRRAPRLPGVVAHATGRLHAVDVTRVGPIPVTTPARTLLDLGAVVAPAIVESAMEGALHRGLLSYDWIERTVGRTARSGRNGSGVLREVLASRPAGAVPTESPLEDDIVRVLVEAGLPPPARQHPVPRPGREPLRLDVAYPHVRLAIEGQSVTWHSGRKSLQQDCDKLNLLVALGWRLLVFTWDDVHRRPHTVVAAVSEALTA